MNEIIFEFTCIDCNLTLVDEFGFNSDAYELPESCGECIIKARRSALKDIK